MDASRPVPVREVAPAVETHAVRVSDVEVVRPAADLQADAAAAARARDARRAMLERDLS